ncbi:hypothetical protein BN891_17120 [Bacteroides xylanisolvens SD CC 2a]|nr:hypothetical protein BN891_17120 [Bacteroides xylanisolvens SD CC 2a]
MVVYIDNKDRHFLFNDESSGLILLNDWKNRFYKSSPAIM